MKTKFQSFYQIIYYSFFLICFFFSANLEAQISIGVKGGYSNAWEDYGDVELPEDAQIDVKGYYVSILSYLKINKHLQVGIEPGFVQRGAACIPGFNPFIGDTEFRLNYIELPLMVRGNFSFAKERLEVFGKVGYGGSMVAKGTEVLTIIGSDEPPEETEIDFQNQFSSLNKYDHGLYGGFGFGFNFGKNQLFVEGNYYHGMRDFDNNNTSKNRSLQIGIGFIRKIK